MKRKIPLKVNFGIYLLYNKDKVIYVGQSRNPKKRIKYHLKHAPFRKEITHYEIIPVPMHKLNEFEKDFIHIYKPKYNKTDNGYYLKRKITIKDYKLKNRWALDDDLSINYEGLI